MLWYSKYHCEYLVKVVSSVAVMAFCVIVTQCTASELAGFAPQVPIPLAGIPETQTQVVCKSADRYIEKKLAIAVSTWNSK